MNAKNRLLMQNLVSTAFVPFVRARNLFSGEAGCKVLAYHRIARVSEGDDRNCIAVSPEAFHMQMQYLHERGYRTISLSRLMESVIGGPEAPILPPLAVLITFDDGFADLLSTALPILQEFRFTASVFVIADRMGTDPTRFLDLSGMESLRQAGWEFGSHSLSHADLTLLDPMGAAREICQSKIELENRLGTDIEAFAYPFGRSTPALEQAVSEAGYRVAFGTNPGVVHSADNPYRIRRIEINAADTPITFARKWTGCYNWTVPYRRAKRTARRLLGAAP